jgi:hypothetical protein
MIVPSSTGAIVTAAKRRPTATAGMSSNAALPGFGAFARAPARNGSPEPHHSGRNQTAGISTAKATMRVRSSGSRNHSHSPYSARKGHASGRISAAATPR